MEFKVTGHWNMSYINPDRDKTYFIELANERPRWITEEDVERLKKTPEFNKFLEENGFKCSLGKMPYMKNPLLAVTDKKTGKNVFSVDYCGGTITHHKDYKDKADMITLLLVGSSLIDADKLYTEKTLEESGITLPKDFN